MDNKRNSRDRALNFMEELGWLLRNYADNDLSAEIGKIVKSTKLNAPVDEFTPANPNIAFLVGALPDLFMNRDNFPKNEDIARFAESILHVSITRFEKRSQYELIGRIVCEVTKLDDMQLEAVVKELKRYLPSRSKINKKSPDEWNEVIQRLSGN